MSHIWSFSQESNILLQKCLDAAASIPPDDTNKWVQRFGIKNANLTVKVENIVLEDSPEVENELPPQENQEEDILHSIEEFTDPETDILSKFKNLEIKCSKNLKLLTNLAENLPISTIDKLIQHIFDSKDINKQFLQNYYEYFLPMYIKKENSRSCTDLLVKAYKLHTEHFNILLKVILKDFEIQSNIINDFITKLNLKEQSEIINRLITIGLSNEEFSHNLFNIQTAYKNCEKTLATQNNIFSLLKTHCRYCVTDKNYGKLLLAYLQHEKDLQNKINPEIEEMIEIHKSPFRRLCINILNEIKSS